MNKILQMLMQFVLLPLVTKGFAMLWKWWEGLQEDKGRDDLIDEGLQKLKEAQTDEERKKALKEFMRGVGSQRLQD